MSSLKTCIIISAELITEIGAVLDDKKVQFSEILGLAPQLLKIPKFVANIQPALAELSAGVTPELMKEINLAVTQKLDLKNNKAEVIVEACVNWIIITSSTVMSVMSAIKSK